MKLKILICLLLLSCYTYPQTWILKVYNEADAICETDTVITNIPDTVYVSGDTPPSIPSLYSPSNLSTTNSEVQFSWTGSSNTDTYRFQLSLESDFGSFVVNDSTLTSATYSIDSLYNDSTYYWRVNAKNEQGTTSYSSVWSFAIIGQISPPNGLVIENYSNSSLDLIWDNTTEATLSKIYIYSGTDSTSLYLIDSVNAPSATYNFAGLTSDTNPGDPDAVTLNAGQITNSSVQLGAFYDARHIEDGINSDTSKHRWQWFKKNIPSIKDSSILYIQSFATNYVRLRQYFKLKSVDVYGNTSAYSDITYSNPSMTKYINYNLAALDSATEYKALITILRDGAYFVSFDTIDFTTAGTSVVACPANMISLYSLEESTNPYIDANGTMDIVSSANKPDRITGKIGYGQSFVATNSDSISIPNHAGINWANTQDWSIEFWILKAATSASDTWVMSRQKDADEEWRIKITATSGYPAITMEEVSAFTLTGNTNVADNAWHHVIFTRNNTDDTVKVFVDGVLKAASVQSVIDAFDYTVPIKIGLYNGVFGTFSIDELAFYNTELTLAEVASHYASGSPTSPVCDGGSPPLAGEDATNYYIDPVAGSDDNTGHSTTQAWATVDKINQQTFSPDDTIFFKSGTTLKGGITISSSGTGNTDRIVLTRYGIGARPILTLKDAVPGWTTSGNWIKAVNDTVWRMTIPNWLAPDGSTVNHKMGRLWLNGTEYAVANYYIQGTMQLDGYYRGDNLDHLDGGPTTYGVNRIHRFYAEPSGTNLNLYVYTSTDQNPSAHYTTMEYAGSTLPRYSWFTLELREADYMSIEGLDVRGGLYASIGVKGSDYLIVDTCNIGKDSRYLGLSSEPGDGYITNTTEEESSHGIVRNCIIDSDYDVRQYRQFSATCGVQFGISLLQGSDNWDVYNNDIKAWAIGILGDTFSKYCDFYNNEIHFENGNYGKGIQWNGTLEQRVAASKFYNNYLHDLTQGMNIGCDSVHVMYNIFENITWAANQHASTGNSGHGVSISSAGSTLTNTSENFIYNNTFKNLDQFAFRWDGAGTGNLWIENNLIINARLQYVAKDFFQLSGLWQKERINNNLVLSTGATTSTTFMYIIEGTVRNTIAQINAMSDDANNETNNNVQHTGTEAALINSDYSLPIGSPAINAGIERVWMRTTDYSGNDATVGIRDIGAKEKQ